MCNVLRMIENTIWNISTCEYLPKRYLVFSLSLSCDDSGESTRFRWDEKFCHTSVTHFVDHAANILTTERSKEKREIFPVHHECTRIFEHVSRGLRDTMGLGPPCTDCRDCGRLSRACFIERARISRFERPVECWEFVASTISRCRVQLFVQSAIPSYDIAIYVSQYRLLIIKNEYKNYTVLLNI